jgi:hypothetical protein
MSSPRTGVQENEEVPGKLLISGVQYCTHSTPNCTIERTVRAVVFYSTMIVEVRESKCGLFEAPGHQYDVHV